MIRKIITAIFTTIVLSNASAQSVEKTVDSNNVFAFKLFNELKGDHNLFFSPFSISSALAMTYAGAHGETEKQMSNVLCFGMEQEKLHKNFEKIMKDIEADNMDSIQLKVANSLWAQKSYHFLEPYFEMVKAKYHSELEYVDYVKETEKARDTINGWVEEKTDNRIKNLVPAGAINVDTRLVLVNALYFRGEWMNTFNKAFTRKNVFNTAKGDTVSAMFMNNGKDDFYYFEDERFQVLELPYKGSKVSMLIFLPREKHDFTKMDNGFDLAYYKRIIPMLKKEAVDISLPKFKTTLSFDISGVLNKMGMPLAFSDAADFSGMTGNKDLFIGKVLHKAFIAVDERGTEAAAATAVMMELSSMRFRNPIIFNADHPFMFIISDNTSGSILFMGQIVNPKQEE